MNRPTGFDDSALHDVQVMAIETTLPTRTPPLTADCLLHGTLPSSELPRVLLTQTALRQIRAHSESNTHVELGGVLLGMAYQHNRQTYVQVEAALPARSNDKGPIHFKFTGDAWSQLHADKETTYPDLEIVGWFHTHPDLGVFFFR